MQKTMQEAPLPTLILFGIVIIYVLTLGIYDSIKNYKLTPEEQKQRQEQRRKDFDDFCR